MEYQTYKDYQVVRGLKFIDFCPVENIEYALDYQAKEGQKFIVTYPKSGTTWTQQIVYLILNNGLPEKNGKGFVFNTLLELSGEQTITEPLLKTHFPYNLLPESKSAKYLYVIRNPKDVSVSFYHYAKGLGYIGDHNKFIGSFLDGELPYGDYFEHLKSFIPHLNDENMTFLVYEQMKRNPREAVLKIADFLGTEFVDILKENNEMILNEVLKYSTVDYMATDSEENPGIIRKGIVGDWKSLYTKEQSDLIDEKLKMALNGTPLQGIWDSYIKF